MIYCGPIVPFPKHMEVGEVLCCGNGSVRDGGPLAWWWHFQRFGNRIWCIRRGPLASLPLPQGSLDCEPQFPILVQSILLSHLHKHQQMCSGTRHSTRLCRAGIIQVAGCGCLASSDSAEMTISALGMVRLFLNIVPSIGKWRDCLSPPVAQQESVTWKQLMAQQHAFSLGSHKVHAEALKPQHSGGRGRSVRSSRTTSLVVCQVWGAGDSCLEREEKERKQRFWRDGS